MTHDTNLMKRTLNDAIGSLRNANGNCIFLIGTGCSKSAGIPLANDLISEIRKKYPEAYREASDKLPPHKTPSYNAVMKQLFERERQDLITPYIEKAKINWAHLALAQLFQAGKIKRVLSVNFDALLVKACALIGFFPAIYDFANLKQFHLDRIAKQSLFYLHGQHTGFIVLNAANDLEKHKDNLELLLRDSIGSNLCWVVGYSGEADPLLDILIQHKKFNGGLYWLGHSATPSDKLRDSGLFNEGRHAFYVAKQDADEALSQAAIALGCFPPPLLDKPFEHALKLLETIDFKTGSDAAQAIQKNLLESLKQAIKSTQHIDTEAREWLLAAQYQRVIDWYQQLPQQQQTDEAKESVSWAYIMFGNDLDDQAQALKDSDLDKALKLWEAAGECYENALAIKPDEHTAAYNWGNVLDHQAKALQHQDLNQALQLWKAAGERYAQALAIKPDDHEAANNWGNVLANKAQALQHQDLNQALQLWKAAGERYAQALAIKPDFHEAAYNWGSILADKAQALKDQDFTQALRLWKAAEERYAQALDIKPDKHEAAHNWGTALSKQAQALQYQDLKQALQLWKAAGERYEKALAIKPDLHETACNWGIDLSQQAQALKDQDLTQALQLWKAAGERYAQALAIKPDDHEAAYNWGVTLDHQAQALQHQDLNQALQLWKAAEERYAQALDIKPDKHEAAFNWGTALALQAQALQHQDLNQALQLWKAAEERYAQALDIKPDKHEAAHN